MAEARPQAAGGLDAAFADLPCLRFARDGRLLYASEEALALFGGPAPPDLAHALMLPGPDAQALLAARDRWRGEAAILRGDALPVPVRLVATPQGDSVVVVLLGDLQAMIGLQASLGDINSDLVNLHRERAKQAHALKALNRALEERDEERMRFYAQVSHELRTPLNSIIGFAEDALDGLAGPVSDEVAGFFRTILTSGNRQLGMVNQLLDFSRLSAGHADLHPKTFQLMEAVAIAARELAPLLRAKQQHLDVDVPAGLTVHADPAKLHQVLINLLGNAHKYIPAGGQIWLRARPEAGRVAIAVQDDGPGIDAAVVPHLFEEFYRAPRPASDRQPGTGLGLAIVHKLVGLMGGRIDVRSAVGAGTTFTVHLPGSPA